MKDLTVKTDASAQRRRACARYLVGGALIAGLAPSASIASAQTTMTLYGGARGGGEFDDANSNGSTFKLDSGAAVSASIDFLLDDGREAQLFYSFQRSALPGKAFGQPADVSVNVSYLHLGGRVFFDGDPTQGGGYVVGGIGATFFAPGLAGLSNEVRPSANLGVGYQWTLTRNIALRTELRGYLTLINANGGFFCSGGCVVSISGKTLAQGEALLGVSVGF